MAKKRATTAVIKSGEYYTYNVSVSFEMQGTFHESDVQPATEGFEHDREPTDRSLNKLKKELKEYLSNGYIISDLDALVNYESFLGKTEIRSEKRPAKLKKKAASKKVNRKK